MGRRAGDRGLMASEAGLQVEYVPLAALASARWDDVLGVATYSGAPSAALPVSNIPAVAIQMPVLAAADAVCEIWRTHGTVKSGRRAAIEYRHTDSVLFGCICLPEPAREADDTPALHSATEHAYREIFATLEELAFPHLLRVWNYLPQINVETHGLERYRQFNSARRNAILAWERDLTGNVPAACALGSVTGSPLVVYFLAAREPAMAIENPRQISAYEYPSQYGPKPAFSRASLHREASQAILFISGTASIVGHQTVHAGNVAAQTHEILVNIEALLQEANRASGKHRFAMESLAYKVYVRDSTDLALIQSQLNTALGPKARLLYLQADVCRQDLLVEIEAVGRAS